ncbi:hypothetical protein P167DRAFT_539670 [Morchella conica CCBAS932]|uniref:Uncharacterized protein n=1 Tax=Morchella conica CCBAS932 TaxID=1392247 RepID=A0A3N4KF42_9PEZI|nr:hypothetical protein P167DRAFT_539670 [Morchella conica CCBAS932]
MGSTPRALPTGGCNFRDLAQAGIALTCGCQKFWRRKRKRGRKITASAGGGGGGGGGRINQSHNEGFGGKEISRIGRFGEEKKKEGDSFREFSSFADDDSDSDKSEEDCRCGHHACYHSFERIAPLPTLPAHPQSTGRRYSLQISDTQASLRLDNSASNVAPSGFSTTEPSQSALATRPFKQNHMYQPSQVGTDLPASKSNSQVTTTGKGDGLRRGDGLGDILQRFQSILENLVSRIEKQAPGNAAGIAEINSKLTKLIKLNEKLENSSRSHTERLETVETYVAVLEEVREKIDLMEDRTNEVDEKIFSFENRLDDRFVTIESRLQKSREKRKLRERGFDEDGSIRVPKRRKGGRGNEHEALPEKTSQLDIRPAVTASFNTNTSASSSLCTDTSADRDSRKITSSLLERLESRLIRMEQNAGPSPQSPWEIEVVMLPPAPLKGIWNDGTEFGGYESSNPQSVSTFSGACSRRKSNDFSDGPVPRSFSVNSRLYRRLGTRGFVKHINVLGPTAQDVAAAVDSSFGKVINWCHSFYTPDESVSPRLPSQYQRVSLGWQPLRKVHKQTNLEFLKPGEMMEIMWTVDFLKGSCIMKGRRAVLYITPLLPTRPSSVSSISWNDIKTLPEYIAVSELDKDTKPPTSLQPDLEDAEDPWAWKETLDDTSEEQAASPSVRSVRSAASWSSFGPFQLEDEARAQHAVDDEEEKEEEEPKLKTPSPANLVDSGLNDCDSLGPPSPPVSFSNKKGKNSSPRQESGSRAREEKTTRRLLRRQKKWKQSQDSLMEEVAAGIEGLTPTLTRTTRSSIRQSSSITTSGKSSSARDSWLSSLSFSAVQANPRTLGWVNDNTIPEDLEEEEENVSGDGTVEDPIDIN